MRGDGQSELDLAMTRLRAYVESEGFDGYDPYDALNARLPFGRLGRWGPVLAIQLHKRNPLNLRPLMGIEKGRNPKGAGLLLRAYALLYERDGDEAALKTARTLFEWLADHPSPGYSGACWGYNFEWANPEKVVPAYAPSVVVTSFVGQGIAEYHRVSGDGRARAVLRSACDFVLQDLPIEEIGDGLCISYTPLKPDRCYNASLLGAELLARTYALTGEASLRDVAERAVRYVVARQHDDGRWNYSVDRTTDRERPQVDFHQGFVLDSIRACVEAAGLDPERYRDTLERGAAFYRREQFTDDGRARWRLPGDWPADIHHQAQGVLTFARQADLDPNYLPFARTVALWTIRNMQDERGYFYYRRYRHFANKISYMRWGQAWMMLALATLAQRAERAREAVPPSRLAAL